MTRCWIPLALALAACGSPHPGPHVAAAGVEPAPELENDWSFYVPDPRMPSLQQGWSSFERDDASGLLLSFRNGVRARVADGDVQMARMLLPASRLTPHARCGDRWFFARGSLFWADSFLGDLHPVAGFDRVRIVRERESRLTVIAENRAATLACGDLDDVIEIQIPGQTPSDILDYAQRGSLHAAVLAGGSLLASVDGGASWQRVPTPGDFASGFAPADTGEGIVVERLASKALMQVGRHGVRLTSFEAEAPPRDIPFPTDEEVAAWGRFANDNSFADWTFATNGVRLTIASSGDENDLVRVTDVDGSVSDVQFEEPLEGLVLRPWGPRTVVSVVLQLAEGRISIVDYELVDRRRFVELPRGLSRTRALLLPAPDGRRVILGMDALALASAAPTDPYLALDCAGALLCVVDARTGSRVRIANRLEGGAEFQHAEVLAVGGDRLLLKLQGCCGGEVYALADAQTGSLTPLPEECDEPETANVSADGTFSCERRVQNDGRSSVLVMLPGANGSGATRVVLPEGAQEAWFLSSAIAVAADATTGRVWNSRTGGMDWTLSPTVLPHGSEERLSGDRCGATRCAVFVSGGRSFLYRAGIDRGIEHARQLREALFDWTYASLAPRDDDPLAASAACEFVGPHEAQQLSLLGMDHRAQLSGRASRFAGQLHENDRWSIAWYGIDAEGFFFNRSRASQTATGSVLSARAIVSSTRSELILAQPEHVLLARDAQPLIAVPRITGAHGRRAALPTSEGSPLWIDGGEVSFVGLVFAQPRTAEVWPLLHAPAAYRASFGDVPGYAWVENLAGANGIARFSFASADRDGPLPARTVAASVGALRACVTPPSDQSLHLTQAGSVVLRFGLEDEIEADADIQVEQAAACITNVTSDEVFLAPTDARTLEGYWWTIADPHADDLNVETQRIRCTLDDQFRPSVRFSD